MKHRKLILVPTILCTLVAGWYAMKPKSWQARQSLVVRDDMIGESFKPGRFESLDSMKTAQETILHIAREPAVIREALEAIGPPRGKRDNWLEGESGIAIVEDTRDAISIVAPNGAEFGKTEVIVLQVKASSRERAGKLVTALLDATEANLRKMRTRRLASMEQELKESLDLAEEDYKQFADELKKLEREIGTDLPTLLNMINDNSANNDFQIALENLRTAKRTAQAQLDVTAQHLEGLKAAVNSPESLVATPNELLEAQPALRRLKEGLIDLQLKLSDDSGRFREPHPSIAKAKFAISEAKRQIHDELRVAIRGLESQQAIQEKQIERLIDEEKQQQERLVRLTNNRANYATLVSQAKTRNAEHAKTRAEYSEIKSLGEAAKTINLMTRLEEPFVSSKPLGIGRTSILGSGMFGGILIGLGLVMFFSAPGSLPIIEPPTTDPGENMVRPVSSPEPPAPVSTRPGTPESSPSTSRKPATRPVQVVKQLSDRPAAPSPARSEKPKTSESSKAEKKPNTADASTSREAPQASAAPSATQPALARQPSVEPLRQEEPQAEAKPKVEWFVPETSETPKAKSTSPAPQASSNQPTFDSSEPPVVSISKLAEEVEALKPPASASRPNDNFGQTIDLSKPEEGPGSKSSPEASSTPTKKPTTKVAPPRVKPDTKSSTPTVGGAGATIPAGEQPARTICLDELRQELKSTPSSELSSDAPPTHDLNQVKQRLMQSASESSANPNPPKDSSTDSIQDRIKRLVEPGKGTEEPGQSDPQE